MNKNKCPNCDIPVLPGRACPECSAENKIAEKKKYTCSVFAYGQRCNSTQNLINMGTSDNPNHWCDKHYAERNKSNTTHVECLKRSLLFAETAKKQGISNYEFFKQYTGMDKPSDLFKQQNDIKRIVAKHNPLYASEGR